MDSTLGEKQGDQAQKKQSGGGVNRGINAINNLMRGGLKNPFGKTLTKVTVQAGSKIATFLFTTPAGWVTIGIVVVVIFTIIIIVGLGGAPSPETSVQPVINPTTTPTPPVGP